MQGKNLLIDILVTLNIKEWWQKNCAVYQKNEYTSLENKEVEPIQPVQMNIYQSNTYKKDLSWLHFNSEAKVQERQQTKDSSPAYPFL